MKIHELAQKTSLTTPTIRFYEKEGLLDTRHVRREENNYRDYCEETVAHLLMLKKLQAAGFTLAELKELVQEEKVHKFPLHKKIEHIRKKMQDIERKQAELEQMQIYLAQMLAYKVTLMGAEEKGDVREEDVYHDSTLLGSLS